MSRIEQRGIGAARDELGFVLGKLLFASSHGSGDLLLGRVHVFIKLGESLLEFGASAAACRRIGCGRRVGRLFLELCLLGSLAFGQENRAVGDRSR